MELIRNEGLMERFTREEKELTQQKLNEIYNEVLQLISKARIDRETEQHYFRTTLEMIGTPVISFDEKGKIEIFNRAAEELLKIDIPANLADMENNYPDFTEFLRKIKNNEQRLFKIQIESVICKLSVKCMVLFIKNQKIKLISFQNINTELEEEEIETWQKLIQILRHEVMNSVAPVKSLTNTILKLLSAEGQPKKSKELTDENIEQAVEGLQAVNKRNKEMLRFVESYRTLTKINTPVFKTVDVTDLISGIKILLDKEFKKHGIDFSYDVRPQNLKIYADENLINQVLINLVKNALEEVKSINNPVIKLEAVRNSDNKILINIMDNGNGIPDDIREQIFLPFFSTKEGGSGIGLSLARQIMRLHHGSIKLHHNPEGNTVFSIQF